MTLTRAKQAEPAPRATPDSDPGMVWRRRDTPPSLVDEQGDTAVDAALFEKLRALRRGLAEERQRAAVRHLRRRDAQTDGGLFAPEP